MFATGKEAAEAQTAVSAILQDAMIWSPSAPQGKQTYAVFRKTFSLEGQPQRAALHLFADNRYVLWINGRYVNRGPCRFDPKRPEYDTLNVAEYLKPGQNVVVILVHYYAIRSFTEWFEQCARMMDHDPGLTLLLDITMPDEQKWRLISDRSWTVSTDTMYKPSMGNYSSVPDEIDARNDTGGWMHAEFDDADWEKAIEINGHSWGKLYPRSIPLLKETPIPSTAIVYENGVMASAELNSRLPLKMIKGDQIVIDIGKTVQAYSIVDFDAVYGSELQLEYVPRFYQIEKKPPSEEKQKCHYIAHAGRQSYMSTDTFGCKYVVVTLLEGEITIHNLEFINRLYPFSRLGNFESSDPMLNQIWEICLNTVEVCCEDAHVDCAERERAQWMADGYLMGYRVSSAALAARAEDGTYFYDDFRLLKNMLRHMALSQLPDGRMQPMRPSEYSVEWTHGVIDDYLCLWVQAFREVYDKEQDKDFLAELWPVAVRTLDYFIRSRTERGLVRAKEFIYFHNPLAYKVCEGASINAFVIGALRDAAYLANKLGEAAHAERYRAIAEQLAASVNEQLWDDAAGGYSGGITENGLFKATAHATLMALYFDIVPAERKQRAMEFMFHHFESEKAFPYTYYFWFEILYREHNASYDRLVLETIRSKWAVMTRHETETTSEFWDALSYIHESGAHPAYFLATYVLGVRSQDDGAGPKVVIRPHLGDLQSARGTVLTALGPAAVSWTLSGSGTLSFEIGISASSGACLILPCHSDRPELNLNGKKIGPDKWNRHNGYIQLTLPAGQHSGSLRV